MAQSTPFGRAFRSKYFSYREDHVPLNHGSFGAFPLIVKEKLISLIDQCENDVDKYTRYDYPREMEKSRKIVSELINVDSSTVVFVPNVTTAINAVLRSLTWAPGDIIITLDICYPGFEKTVEYIVESTPAETQMVDIKWPCEDDELITKFEETVKAIRESGRNPRLAIIDTISSLPGMRLPYEELVRKCTELDVLSFIDGAHGIGQIKIDLTATQPSFFTSNLHKWLFTPRGCAILYVPEQNQHLIRSSIPTSFGYQAVPRPGQRKSNNPFPPPSGNRLHALFDYVGTANNDAYLTIPNAMEFRKTICGGEANIMDYITNLAKIGGDRAARILGTEVLDNSTHTLRQCAFANIRLPLEYGDDHGKIPVSDIGKIARFIAEESVKANTFFPVILYNGYHWWRISATIMIEEDDIIWGANVMKNVCERVKRGDYINNQSV